MTKPRTLYDKIWDDHLVDEQPDGTCLIYIDRHLVHEVTSPQAFEGLRMSGRKVHAPEKTLLVVDHNVPTTDRSMPNPDPESAEQIATLAENAKDFGLEYYNEFDKRQGIVHIIGPEQGFTLPGTTIVCGDSHTATHGAFGALAYGIGTSEVEHVLATQTLIQTKSKNMRAMVDGKLPADVTAKDIILAIIGEIGTAGGTGYALEYAGEAIRALSMEGRMTVCNMSIEGGAKAGMIAPDEKTYDYLKGRPKAPKGEAWDGAMRYWDTLRSDDGAHFDHEIRLDAAKLPPLVTWGTSPEQVVSITGRVPSPDEIADEHKRRAAETLARIYGPQAAARRSPTSSSTACSSARAPTAASRTCARSRAWWKARRVNANVNAMIVPGSGLVKEQAEAEGLDKIFIKAGFEWREPGCSMCLAMNPDKLKPGERCASTSNRNFEGRQGYKGRTHLVSPAMAAPPRSPAISSTCASGIDLSAAMQRQAQEKARHLAGLNHHTVFLLRGLTTRSQTRTVRTERRAPVNSTDSRRTRNNRIRAIVTTPITTIGVAAWPIKTPPDIAATIIATLPAEFLAADLLLNTGILTLLGSGGRARDGNRGQHHSRRYRSNSCASVHPPASHPWTNAPKRPLVSGGDQRRSHQHCVRGTTTVPLRRCSVASQAVHCRTAFGPGYS